MQLQSLRKNPTSTILGVFGLLLISGCGRALDDIGRVSGRVTLDGQPLANATVIFSPTTPGNQFVAVTDADGEYSLLYSAKTRGAEPGEHRVTISTFSKGDPDGDPPVSKTAERVPYRYNLRSELTASVERGNNAVHFDLDSHGPVVQPDNPRSIIR